MTIRRAWMMLSLVILVGALASGASAAPPKVARGSMIYTSGTTGRPKGVQIRHRSAYYDAFFTEALLSFVETGLASLAGYGLFQHASPGTVAFVLAFAAGAILTMLADTMMPEAFQHGGKLVGVVTTLGFATAFTIHLLD